MDCPKLVVIAGPNGSGKTTLTHRLREQGVDFGEYINPDDIAASLQGLYDRRVRAAQKIADERRDACVRERRSFSFETVMSHASKIDIMRAARDAGFHVTLYFVGTEDPRINIARVSNRVSLGGHDVPHERIVSRYLKTMDALMNAVEVVDQAFLIDNSDIRRPLTTWIGVRAPKFHSTMFERGHSAAAVERLLRDEACPRWITRHFLQKLGGPAFRDFPVLTPPE